MESIDKKIGLLLIFIAICLVVTGVAAEQLGYKTETTTTWESARTEINTNQYPKTTTTWDKPTSRECYTVMEKGSNEIVEAGCRW